jgi:regulatory protein SWI6
MHGTGHRCHAQARGLLRERNSNTQSRRCRQGEAYEDPRERNSSWETRNSARRLRQIPRNLVRAGSTFLEIMDLSYFDEFFRIPLERGRDIALQYGVAPLLAPLFDFTPASGGMNSLTSGNPGIGSPRPLSASASFSGLGTSNNYSAAGLAPPPIMPGSALRLLNQGRAQGLFTPSTSLPAPAGPGGHVSPRPYYSGTGYTPSPFSGISTPPPPNPPLKRTRSDEAESSASGRSQFSSFQTQVSLDPALEIRPADASRASSIAPQVNGDDGPSPNKRVRKEPSMSDSQQIVWQLSQGDQDNAMALTKQEVEVYVTRSASKPTLPRGVDPTTPLKDSRRVAVINAICQIDDPSTVLSHLRGIIPDNIQAFPPPSESGPPFFDVDIVLDDQGHTALHLAASMARLQTVDALVGAGADIHRGNYLGETPLIRACVSTHNSDAQTFHALVASLHASIRTLDTSRKSVLHHIMAVAGVKGRAVVARYYLDQIFFWIAQKQGGDFKSIIDLQDEHGDTALNVAARVGNRSLVRTLLDVGANRILQNKLGLRPGDFGVESEVGHQITQLGSLLKMIIVGTGRWGSRGRFNILTSLWPSSPCPEEPGRYSW